MDFAMAMKYIEEKTKLGTVPGLVNVKELLRRLGNPQNEVKCLHIAGTNGKGSIFAYVEQILLEAGYKVGRYISPTIFDYRERFTINKEYISKERLADLIGRISVVVEEMVAEGGYDPTAFEIETALAFLYYYEEKVDFALIECGMGGTLDATNVIANPLVTVMASISMDHMQFLGETQEEIARNKAGIMRPNGYTVSYPQKKCVQNILFEEADRLSCEMIFADSESVDKLNMNIMGSDFNYKGKVYHISLLGKHQIFNSITALEVVFCLRSRDIISLEDSVISSGLDNTRWAGRMTRVCDKPPIFVDGAHNEDAWMYLKNTINMYFTNSKIIYIIGVLKDKEYNRMLDILCDTMEYCITVTPNTPRGLSNEILRDLICERGIPAETAADSDYAIERAKSLAGDDGIVLVSGSLSFIADYLRL